MELVVTKPELQEESMDEQIITIYCLCNDLLRSLHHYEDPQCTMSDTEVKTTALIAARFFRGNLEQARIFLQAPRYMPSMLSKSGLIRRLHCIRPLFLTLFEILDAIQNNVIVGACYAASKQNETHAGFLHSPESRRRNLIGSCRPLNKFMHEPIQPTRPRLASRANAKQAADGKVR